MMIGGHELADGATVVMGGVTMMAPPVRGRACGQCRACCVQVPVDLPTGKKLANEPCEHLCSKGCGIYADRPSPCQVWSCRWLFDAGTAELRRPDQSGYVIDCMPDRVIATDDGRERIIPVLQVWVDPKRRDAHRDPALRRYLAGIFERHGFFAVVRWSSGEGMVLIPPGANPTGGWVEFDSQLKTGPDMAARLRAAEARRTAA